MGDGDVVVSPSRESKDAMYAKLVAASEYLESPGVSLDVEEEEASDRVGSGLCCGRGLRRVRRAVQRALEDPESGRAAAAVNKLIFALILASTFCAVAVTVPELEESHRHTFILAEQFFTAAFTAEILIRAWTSPSLSAYFCSLSNLIDILATLPWYMEEAYKRFLPRWSHHAHLAGVAGSFRVLRVSRFVRMLRLAKAARHSDMAILVAESLAASYRGLLTLFSFLTLGSVVSATLAYAAESEGGNAGSFVSIPAAMWWSMTTITTVGYGDMVPATTAGKLVGCATMVGGTLIVSLSVAMISTSFTEHYRQQSERLKIKKKLASQSQGNSVVTNPTAQVSVEVVEVMRRLQELEEETTQVLIRLEGTLKFSASAQPRQGSEESRTFCARGPDAQALESVLLDNLKGQAATFFQAAKGLAGSAAETESAAPSQIAAATDRAG